MQLCHFYPGWRHGQAKASKSSFGVTSIVALVRYAGENRSRLGAIDLNNPNGVRHRLHVQHRRLNRDEHEIADLKGFDARAVCVWWGVDKKVVEAAKASRFNLYFQLA
jgi:hypothetical protein